MMGLYFLVLSACLLLAVQQASRHACRRSGLFSCETFILGNWAFVFLHGVVLYFTGGKDWGALKHYTFGHVLTASSIVALGLLCFAAGAWLGAESWMRRGSLGSFRKPEMAAAPKPLDDSEVPGERKLVGLLGISLAMIGSAASFIDTSQVMGQGLEGRSSALLMLAQLVVPGIVFCLFMAVSRRSSWLVRIPFAALALLSMVSAAGQYSRRPVIVAAACCLFLWTFTRRGFIKRRYLFTALPVLWVLAAGFLFARRILYYQYNPEGISVEAVFNFYLDKLWLETSAFGGLMYIVKHFGVTEFLGGESFWALFVLWIPRSIFPSKPLGFDLVTFMDHPYPYNLPPTLYGELLINFSLFGIIPALLLMGFVLKRIDLRAMRSSSITARLVYLMFLFDIIFVVRGSFTPMMFPLLLHALLPLGALQVWKAFCYAKPPGKGN